VTQIHRSGIRTLMELAMRDPEAIRLEIGEPDATTPAHVVAAASRDAAAGHTASRRRSAGSTAWTSPRTTWW
jgi:aspartate aminotransferase